MNNDGKIHKIKFIPERLSLKRITLKNLGKALLERRNNIVAVLLMPLFTPASPVFVYIFIPSILNVFLVVMAIVYTLFSLSLLLMHKNNYWAYSLFVCPLYLFGGTMAAFLLVFLFDLSLFAVAMTILNAVGIIVISNTINYLQCSLGKLIRIPAFVLVSIALSSYCFVCLNLLHIITLPPAFLYTLISLPAACVFITFVMIVFLEMLYGQVFNDMHVYNSYYVERINKKEDVAMVGIQRMKKRINRLQTYQLFSDKSNQKSIELAKAKLVKLEELAVNKTINDGLPIKNTSVDASPPSDKPRMP